MTLPFVNEALPANVSLSLQEKEETEVVLAVDRLIRQQKYRFGTGICTITIHVVVKYSPA
jgi:hypothetical protein